MVSFVLIHKHLTQILLIPVCQTSSACQNAFNKVSNGTISSLPSIDGSSSQNNSLTCNTSPRVYAAGEMSCDVIVRPLPVHISDLYSFCSLRTRHFRAFSLYRLTSTSSVPSLTTYHLYPMSHHLVPTVLFMRSYIITELNNSTAKHLAVFTPILAAAHRIGTAPLFTAAVAQEPNSVAVTQRSI
jgi:hypothetical protein